jgi:L-fuconolactonase
MRDAPLRFTLLAGVMALLSTGASPSVAEAKSRPIMDTHIHLYQVTRPGGVPWPEAKNKILYKDMTPEDYKAQAKKVGIVGTGIVEASPIHEDNLKILAMTKKDKFFKFLVAQEEIGSADFAKNLEELSKDKRVVGIRGYLWSPGKITLNEKESASLADLSKRGMTLDLISRGDKNPKAGVIELATKFPDLRIIIDHMAGAKGEKPDPKWVEDMKKLAEHKNIYIKFSAFFDMFNPKASEDEPWQAPLEASAYKPHLDVLISAFGEDRLIWGSNWPVIDLGGGVGTGLANEVKVAEELLKPLGTKVRDKIMFQNAQKFYKRIPTKS